MRFIVLIPLLCATVAACGEGESEPKEAATKAARPASGQWELVSEVSAFRVVDGGAPKIDTPVGTRATETVCVGEGQLPTDLFSGENFQCNYDNYYVRNGRLNVTLQCAREGLSGSVPMTVSGTFEENSLEYERDLRSVLASDGDVQIRSRVTARRTGACTRESDGGNQSNSTAG